MRYLRSVFGFARILALLGLGTAPPAQAMPVGFDFAASLQTGALAETTFRGTGSYDTTGTTGVGEEFVTLTWLQFSLLGVPFTRADIDQGGQAILEDGVLSYFTAAFFPPPPDNSPVSDIAFGFGGPGIIGYFTSPDVAGSGTYTVSSLGIPEPPAVAVFGFALLVMTLGASRGWSSRWPIYAGSGSTGWPQSRQRTRNRTRAAEAVPRVIGGPLYRLTASPCTGSTIAEGFFSRMRRAEIGDHHHLAGPYLIRFAQEAAWREDHRQERNGDQVDRLVTLAMANRPSVDFCGYSQRAWTS